MNVTEVNRTSPSSLLPRSEGIAYVAAFIVEFVVIIIGNAVVIAVFARRRQLRQRKSHWLLINLAITDLLVGAITGPFWLYFLAARCDLWDYEDNIYLLIAIDVVFLLSSAASQIDLAIISLERMYATLWPWKHRALKARNYHVMIGLSWSLPIFLPCVSIAERYGRISLDVFNYIWLSSSCFFILIIIVSYASIWIKFKFYTPPQHHANTTQDRKLTMSVFLVTAASIMTFLPGIVLSVVFAYPQNNVMSALDFNRILSFAAQLIFASSLVNPIIYSFRMPQFRRAALRVFWRRSTFKR